MTVQINRLPDDLVNKIAAGEVVERPASVVKELLENSLDAGATRIKILIRDGGKKLVQVSDNGHGISPEQLDLAIERHTSSKITQFDDLYALKTKGFRGEALASICSVAKVTVSSAIKDHDPQEILVEAGRAIDRRACAHPVGTTVTVKYLFFQTPARLKFLKTSPTETSHIVDVVTKLALCHPHVGFFLHQDQTTLLEVPENQDGYLRVLAILGKDFADNIYAFSEEAEQMQLYGYFGHPQMAKSQRSFCFMFVNGRPVSDKVLWHAVMEAYRDLLMRGKYPVVVLHLHMNEALLDVNVHPQKSEVRFHKSQQVHQFVYQSLKKQLSEAPWLTREQGRGGIGDRLSVVGCREEEKNQSIETANKSHQQKEISYSRTLFGRMQPLGQVMGTYVLCEADSKLFIIDQHAAHERIGFEKLIKQYKEDGISSAPLLIPETFDLKPSDAEILKKYLDELIKFGFDIEFFGGQTFVLKGLPSLLQGRVAIIPFIHDLVEDVKETGHLKSLTDKVHAILMRISCHAQIRANQHLELQEIQALLNELDEYPFTDFCPHGRPVCVDVSKDE
ncbi:DNA mismatch repair endonuclease MutL, partial [bacterium]|nr:DNA mismatch repair endonuclease MutL [bacterium]MBU1919151.1 DNA mismatch repair endonuclease MutL [bacterium]